MEWACGNCGNTDQADIRRTGPGRWPQRAVCRRCRRAKEHHIPWKTYLEWVAWGCGACGWHPEPPLPGDRAVAERLEVDHDRRCCPGDLSCGRCVRGLLCGPCNRLVRDIENGRVAACLRFLGIRRLAAQVVG